MTRVERFKPRSALSEIKTKNRLLLWTGGGDVQKAAKWLFSICGYVAFYNMRLRGFLRYAATWLFTICGYMAFYNMRLWGFLQYEALWFFTIWCFLQYTAMWLLTICGYVAFYNMRLRSLLRWWTHTYSWSLYTRKQLTIVCVYTYLMMLIPHVVLPPPKNGSALRRTGAEATVKSVVDSLLCVFTFCGWWYFAVFECEFLYRVVVGVVGCCFVWCGGKVFIMRFYVLLLVIFGCF